ncbi:hypothetical protein FE251_03795 [Georgenia wutianyii]|uniref:Uncharacterized protein n=1 Tax=Georgenia wutianyii TaxID=2585135 RepID=A0ABX5VNH8_9MICO|nr:hypothetical protein [Georgenia wutianyii]QDB78599.1 hypothetical protein FE251_03795 [Georgenia wutianyii]
MSSSKKGGVMVVHGVEMLTREQALERRDQLREQLGLSEADMRDRAANYELTLHQSALVDEIDGLNYLLAAASR